MFSSFFNRSHGNGFDYKHLVNSIVTMLVTTIVLGHFSLDGESVTFTFQVGAESCDIHNTNTNTIINNSTNTEHIQE